MITWMGMGKNTLNIALTFVTHDPIVPLGDCDSIGWHEQL